MERLIGTLRREYLDNLLFWTTTDLENKLLDFRTYFNNHRTHTARGKRRIRQTSSALCAAYERALNTDCGLNIMFTSWSPRAKQFSTPQDVSVSGWLDGEVIHITSIKAKDPATTKKSDSN